MAKRAAETLGAQGYEEVKTRRGDGYFGWPEFAPYDAIIVTCAAGHLPPPLWGTYFYTPSDQGYENAVQDRLEMWRKAQRQALGIETIQFAPELTEDDVLETKRRHGRTGVQEPATDPQS